MKIESVTAVRPNGAAQLPLEVCTPPQTTTAAPTFLQDGYRIKMLITPEQAQQWLTNNTCNRNLIESHVFAYACDMETGRWVYNYCPIIISREGVVIDGQHRLSACVLSKQPFWSDVVFGAKMEIQPTVDIGIGRTVAHQAQINRIANSTRVAALVNLVLVDLKGGIGKMSDSRYRPTKPEQTAFIQAHNDELQAAIGSRWDHICPPRVADFCNYKFRQRNPELAEKFMADVMTGDGVDAHSAAGALRKRLIDNGASKAKLPTKELVALFYKAWRAYVDKKSIRVLRWTATEPFPEI